MKSYLLNIISKNFELATFIAANRPGVNSNDARVKIEKLRKKYGAKIRSVTVPSLDISSTYIREHINKGRNESVQYRGVFISQQYSRRGNKIDLTDRIHHFQQYDLP